MIFMLFIAALPMSYLAAMEGGGGGFVAALFQTARPPSQPILTPNVKVPPPTKSPPIIKGPWVAVLPRFQPPVWLLSVGRAAQAISRAKRTGPRGPWGREKKRKKKNLIQNTAKNKLKRGLLDRNYRPSSRPLRQHSRAAVISDRKGY